MTHRYAKPDRRRPPELLSYRCRCDEAPRRVACERDFGFRSLMLLATFWGSSALIGCTAEKEVEPVPFIQSMDEIAGPIESLYVVCGEHEAETILLMHVDVPLSDDHEIRVPLRKDRVRSSQYIPVHLGLANATGISPSGESTGYNQSCLIDVATAKTITLQFQVSWQEATGRGHVDSTIVANIDEESVHDLGSDVRATVRFVEPDPLIDPS